MLADEGWQGAVSMRKSFEERVWSALRRIPEGKVTTYALIAQAIGKLKAARAVGNACRKNPNAPSVPCHRVVRSDGGIGGYARGVQRKAALLGKEGVSVRKGRILAFQKKLFKFREP